MTDRITVLVVDDDPKSMKLSYDLLSAFGYRIFTATDGRQALEIARNDRPGLIYMDLNMPEMDGATCCAALKSDPELRAIPVVLVTTAGMQEGVEQCVNSGCDGFLTKPIDRKAFLDMGRKFLSNIDRREKRIACKLKALFRINSGGNLYGTCVDLSSRGLFIACSEDVNAEDKVEVSMLVSGSSTDLVEAWGRVAWVNPGASRKKQILPAGFGVEFLSIPNESAYLVMRFIEQEGAE